MNKHTWFGSENLELELTEQQFMSIKHNGEDCSPQIEIIRKDPMIEEQLKKLNQKDVLEYLIEQGCWERFELNQHEHNLNKIVWIACEDICHELYEQSNDAERNNPAPRKLSDLLIQNAACVSMAEVRRLCAQGAVKQLSVALDCDSPFLHPSVAPITIGKRKVIDK